MAPQIELLTRGGIPVMAHIGFTPQSEHTLGGYRVQGRGDAAARILEDAQAVEAAGAFAVVMEMVPGDVAGEVTKELAIPTIGIGAGADCDGQVLVWQDAFGLRTGRMAKFVKQYADLHGVLLQRGQEYAADVGPAPSPGPSTPSDRRQVRRDGRAGAGCMRTPVARPRGLTRPLDRRASRAPATAAPAPGAPAGAGPAPAPAAQRAAVPRAAGHPRWSPVSTTRGTCSRSAAGRLLITERDRRDALACSRTAHDPRSGSRRSSVWVVRRDRPDVARGRPELRQQPPLLHLPGRLPRPAAATTYASSPGGSTTTRPRRPASRTLAQRPPGHQRPPRRLPAADRAATASLLVGTGDAASRHEPARTCNSLGGKTLRLNRATGAPWPSNPYIDAATATQRYVHDLRPPQRPGPRPARATARSGRSSRAPTATTRSTCSSTAATTAGTRCRATTSASR